MAAAEPRQHHDKDRGAQPKRTRFSVPWRARSTGGPGLVAGTTVRWASRLKGNVKGTLWVGRGDDGARAVHNREVSTPRISQHRKCGMRPGHVAGSPIRFVDCQGCKARSAKPITIDTLPGCKQNGLQRAAARRASVAPAANFLGEDRAVNP